MKIIKKYSKYLLFLACFIIYNINISYLNTKVYEIENELYYYDEEEIEYPDIAV